MKTVLLLGLGATLSVSAEELPDCRTVFDLYTSERMELADRSWIAGNLYARELVVGNDSRLEAAVNLQKPPTIGHRVVWNETWEQVIDPPECSIAFPKGLAGQGNIEVNNGMEMELEPGSYGSLLIRARSRVYLKKGVYVFSNVSVEPDASLTWEAEEGDLQIAILGNLQLGDRSRLEGQIPSDVRVGGGLSIGTDAWINATISAPNSNARVASRTQLQKPLLAKSLRLEPDVGNGAVPVIRSTILDESLLNPPPTIDAETFDQWHFRVLDSETDDLGQSQEEFRNKMLLAYSQYRDSGLVIPLRTIKTNYQVVSNGSRQTRSLVASALAKDIVRTARVGIAAPRELSYVDNDAITHYKIKWQGMEKILEPDGVQWWQIPPHQGTDTLRILTQFESGQEKEDLFTLNVDADSVFSDEEVEQ